MANTLNLDQRNGEFYRLRLWKHQKPGLPIYPCAVEETRRVKGPVALHSYHEYFIVLFMSEGCLRHTEGDRKMEFPAGHVLIVPPGLSAATSEGGYHKYMIGLAGCQIEQLFSAFKLNDYFKFPMDIGPLVKIHRELFRKMHAKNLAAIPALTGDCMKLLATLSLALPSGEAPGESRLADQIRSTLEAEFDNPQSLATLSANSGIAHATLHRVFKDKFGTSPKRYQFECRMRRARELLEISDMSMKEIADRVGFQNQYYFSNAVKREYNLPPRELRIFLRQSKHDRIIPPMR